MSKKRPLSHYAQKGKDLLRVGQLYKVNNATLVVVRELRAHNVLVEFPPHGNHEAYEEVLTYGNRFVAVRSWDEPL